MTAESEELESINGNLFDIKEALVDIANSLRKLSKTDGKFICSSDSVTYS